MELLQWAAIPSIFVGGAAGIALRNAIGLSLNLQILGITRGSESEADTLGAQYAWHAGYDPNGFITFFEKMLAMEKKQPGKFASWFRTITDHHRIANIQKIIDQCLPIKPKVHRHLVPFRRGQGPDHGLRQQLLAANKATSGNTNRTRKGWQPTLMRRTDTELAGWKPRPTVRRNTRPSPLEEGNGRRGQIARQLVHLEVPDGFLTLRAENRSGDLDIKFRLAWSPKATGADSQGQQALASVPAIKGGLEARGKVEESRVPLRALQAVSLIGGGFAVPGYSR
jgi:hypothetical protein